jgi:hypothetical protein
MIKKEITLYEFTELDTDIQNKILNDFDCSNIVDFDLYEYVASLKEFCKQLNIELRDYYLGDYHSSYIKFKITDKNLLELSGHRLAKYLYNNYSSMLYSYRKYYKKNKYISKVFTEFNDCSLTGNFTDYKLLDGLIKFIEKPDKNHDINDLLNDIFDSFLKEINNQIDYYNSDQFKIEHIAVNEYLFYDCGQIARI